MNTTPLPKAYQAALVEQETRETSRLKYFYEFKLKPFFKKHFKKHFSDVMLDYIFNEFYNRYYNYPIIVEFDNSFKDYDEFIRESELSTEISEICEYWFMRNATTDRIKDDQMLIRLIRIRHKLPY